MSRNKQLLRLHSRCLTQLGNSVPVVINKSKEETQAFKALEKTFGFYTDFGQLETSPTGLAKSFNRQQSNNLHEVGLFGLSISAVNQREPQASVKRNER